MFQIETVHLQDADLPEFLGRVAEGKVRSCCWSDVNDLLARLRGDLDSTSFLCIAAVLPSGLDVDSFCRGVDVYWGEMWSLGVIELGGGEEFVVITDVFLMGSSISVIIGGLWKYLQSCSCENTWHITVWFKHGRSIQNCGS